MAEDERGADTAAAEDVGVPARSTADRVGTAVLVTLVALIGLAALGGIAFLVMLYLFVAECSC